MTHLYWLPYLNNIYSFCWKSIRLCYANAPFSQIAKVLTKRALEEARVVLCTPDRGSTWKYAYWRHLLDRMKVQRTELQNPPIYVSEDSQEAMPPPEWLSFLSIVEGSLNPVLVSDRDQELLKESIAEN